MQSQLPDAEGYVLTNLAAASVVAGRLTPVTIGRRQLLVTRLEGRPVAFDRLCPHAAADLKAGDLGRHRLTCPQHGWKFDLRSGRCLWPADESTHLRLYSVKETAGRLAIQL